MNIYLVGRILPCHMIKMDIIWIIILSVLVVGIIIGIVVGKKIWDNKRKKRANELVDDDYEYKTGEKVEPIINE